jgi:quinol monooxygenase YgiN
LVKLLYYTSKEKVMIIIRVLVNIQETTKAKFLELLSQEAKEVRRLEGCLTFNIFEDVSSETSLLLYEEWQSLEAFNAYRNSVAFKEMGQELFPLMDGRPDSAYYSAEIFS